MRATPSHVQNIAANTVPNLSFAFSGSRSRATGLAGRWSDRARRDCLIWAEAAPFDLMLLIFTECSSSIIRPTAGSPLRVLKAIYTVDRPSGISLRWIGTEEGRSQRALRTIMASTVFSSLTGTPTYHGGLGQGKEGGRGWLGAKRESGSWWRARGGHLEPLRRFERCQGFSPGWRSAARDARVTRGNSLYRIPRCGRASRRPGTTSRARATDRPSRGRGRSGTQARLRDIRRIQDRSRWRF